MALTPEDVWKSDAVLWAKTHPKKTGRINKHPERDFQEAVVALLNLQYDCTIVAIDNAKQTKLIKTRSGRMVSVEGAGLKRQGKRKGAGDLILHWWHNQYGYLELKWDAPHDDDQKEFGYEIVQRRGGKYAVIRKQLDQVHTICQAWGIPKKGGA